MHRCDESSNSKTRKEAKRGFSEPLVFAKSEFARSLVLAIVRDKISSIELSLLEVRRDVLTSEGLVSAVFKIVPLTRWPVCAGWLGWLGVGCELSGSPDEIL